MSPAQAREVGARRADWAFLLAGPFLLLAPLTTFVAHAGYPFLAPELLLCQLAIGGAGLFAGAILAFAPPWVRVLGATALLSVLIDVQSGWFSSLGLRKGALIVVGVAALCWVLRSRLGSLLAVVGGVLWLTSFLVPAAPGWQSQGEATQGPADLGPYVQIILDEHIGLEGIPAEFDPDGALAERIRSDYERRGFTVFPRMYSRYANTGRAIPAALNFNATGEANPFVEDASIEPVEIVTNATFQQLHARGYQIHAVQNDFLDLCHVAGELVVEQCATYSLNTIATIRDLPVGTWSKADMILDMFLHRSEFDRRIRRALRLSEPRRVSPVATMRVADSIVSMLRKARPGDAFLIHLMLPHFPYVFDAQCNMRPDPDTWLDVSDPAATPRLNTPESRRIRYPLYLEQVQCTQQLVARMLDALVAAGVYDQSTILIHGDHGSRLAAGPAVPPYPVGSLQPQDIVDTFSTFFVAKLPGVPGGTDRRMLPLGRSLGSIIRDRQLLIESPPESPSVWVDVGDGQRLDARPMPVFEHGRVDASSAD